MKVCMVVYLINGRIKIYLDLIHNMKALNVNLGELSRFQIFAIKVSLLLSCFL